MNFTDEIEDIEEQDEEVVLAVKIKEFGNKEREGKMLYEEGKLTEVIAHRKAYITELKEFKDKDKSGRISRLIESAEKQLSNLEAELEENKLLSTMTASEVEFYRKFGKVPPVGRKRPLVGQKNEYTLTQQIGLSTKLVPVVLVSLLPSQELWVRVVYQEVHLWCEEGVHSYAVA